MKTRKNRPVLLLVVAAILLLASSVGGTRAALTYFSDNYVAEVNVSNIDVELLENGTVVDETLELAEEAPVPGKIYDEVLTVRNKGDIDAYVRMIVTKSWNDADGKNTTLDPAYIVLNAVEDGTWVKDADASTQERDVYYYAKVLAKGQETEALTDTFRVDPVVAKELIQSEQDGVITYVYKYNGYEAVVEVEVDAVQASSGADAIKSAWGINAEVAADGSLSLK